MVLADGFGLENHTTQDEILYQLLLYDTKLNTHTHITYTCSRNELLQSEERLSLALFCYFVNRLKEDHKQRFSYL